jgi:hypothetical protein
LSRTHVVFFFFFQINEYVLLNSKTIKLHMKYENIILNIYY